MGLFDWLRSTPRRSTEELLAEARTRAEASQFDEALQIYSRIRRRDRTPLILVEMARSALAAGKDWIALDCANQALDRDPDCGPAIAFQYEIRLRQSPKMEAELRGEALASAQWAEIFHAAVGLHSQGRYREALPLARQAVQSACARLGENHPDHAASLTILADQKERLEAELARQIPEMNLERKLRAADRRAVALGLPEGIVLVEFVRLHVFDFRAVAEPRGETQWDPPQRWRPARYLSFILPGGEPDQVQMIDLGEAEPIDRLITDFRVGIIGEGAEDMDRNMVVKHRPEPAPAMRVSAGAALRAAVFDKLTPALGGCTRLLLAPDGDLAQLPFEVLPTEDGRLLIDRYAISYVGCGRDVLRFGVATAGQPTAALVVADPDFDFGGEGATPSAPSEMPRDRRSRHVHHLAFPVERLPATRVEGERIAAVMGVHPWLGSAALEGRLKDGCRSPRILHLATHGFFLEDQTDERDGWLQRSEGLAGLASGPGRLSGPLPENPLLRAGLVLAGANTWHATGPAHPDAEDGLLTAEDVSGMDLLATELVVLSACETGLGEVHTGEGVFGLQRAFVLAGAKTLVMSLWKVPDLTTALLMDRFYENLLQRRSARDAALRDAQQYVRNLTVKEIRVTWLSSEMIDRLAAGNTEAKRDLDELARRPDEHRPFADPYYWGAFICQGQPGPLPVPARSGS
jgi:CHAT domain-containing protein